MGNEIKAQPEDDSGSKNDAEQRGELLLLDPPGNTHGIREKDVLSVYESLSLDNDSVIFLITSWGVRTAPGSERSRDRLASLGFTTTSIVLNILKSEIKTLAEALSIGLHNFNDGEINRLEDQGFEFKYIHTKDLEGSECLLVAAEGKLWVLDSSQENYDQLDAWKFFHEELKVKRLKSHMK